MFNLLVNVFYTSHQKKMTNKEKIILEVIIFKHICDELKNYFCQKNETTGKNLIDKDKQEMDGKMIGKLVNDLITNNDYSVSGLAVYTGYPEDVIYDLASGLNRNPTIELSNKIIELHFIARRELYSAFLENIKNTSQVNAILN